MTESEVKKILLLVQIKIISQLLSSVRTPVATVGSEHVQTC